VAVASTIIVAREDLSIPGANELRGDQGSAEREHEQTRFFDLLRESKPDVVVLNLTVTEGRGVQTIRKVREQSGLPILVVCATGDPLTSDYRTAGAAECFHPPVDVALLNRSIQNLMGGKLAESLVPPPTEGYRFHGITYRPDRNCLQGASGTLVELTAAENAVLRYLFPRSWSVCSRAEIANFVYSESSPATEKRVGVVVNQLREKLQAAEGETARLLIKTEFRRGYLLAADVVAFPLDVPEGQ
jgi:DNA-binding response OmpR family regulator